jgi:response regulator RpfG family c-di-GMP phosphodiesterase
MASLMFFGIAWSEPDALKYIREQSEKYSDPQVVEIFLKEFGSE